MKTTGIKIVNQARGKHVALHTKVYIVREDDAGNEDFVDISNFVRAVDARLHVGEVVTAKLECFITSIETRALLSELVLRDVRPRKRRLWKRLRDVTTFGSKVNEYVVR